MMQSNDIFTLSERLQVNELRKKIMEAKTPAEVKKYTQQANRILDRVERRNLLQSKMSV